MLFKCLSDITLNPRTSYCNIFLSRNQCFEAAFYTDCLFTQLKCILFQYLVISKYIFTVFLHPAIIRDDKFWQSCALISTKLFKITPLTINNYSSTTCLLPFCVTMILWLLFSKRKHCSQTDTRLQYTH